MFIVFDAERPSDSPFIERVWSCHSEGAGIFLSVASSHCELVVARVEGHTTVTLRGPETRVREVACPADGEWFAIRFKAGTFMPHLPVSKLIDGNDVNLPQPTSRSFELNGSKWEIPDFDNGVAINDAVHEAGFFDQAHLTRSLKSLIGLTPSKIAREQHQLSFLYKTDRDERPYDRPLLVNEERK